MAESSSSSSSPSSPASSSGSTSGQSKQYIRASANDDALEPDALRGNEDIIKKLNIQNDDEDRRKKMAS